MNEAKAETIGIQALGWLAGEEDHFYRFLAMSGIDTAELAARAQEPEFLGFVLDFLLSDDALVIGFCEQSNLPNDLPMKARAQLPGGEIPNWT